MRGWWFGVWLAACTGQSAAPDDPEVSPAEADADGDGVSLIDGDCDDHDNARAPTVAERCNGVDDDCDGRVDDDPFDGAPRFVDADGDGFGDPRIQRIVCADAPGLVDDDRDCDDGDAAISPDAWEVCNGIDDDCDRAIDDADVDEADKRLARGEPIPVPLLGGATLYHPDFDGDGWPTLAGAVWACAPELGYVEPAGAAGPWDCDDDDDGLHPGAAEGVAPGQDLDCDGVVRCWADADGDGHGDARVVVTSAEPSCQAEGVAADGADCDDADPAINHERPEVCDPGSRVDEDCDGLIDDADPSAVGQIESYLDADHDGWASAGPPLASCRAVAGASPTPGGDCRDDRRDVYPGAPELCDGVDNNCDSQADEGTDAAPSCWFDADQDGWGDDGTEFGSCDCLRDRGVPRGGDCDAFVRGINPGAVDVCNGVDDDCTGVADDDPRTSLLLFGDGDGDGHGDAADPRWLCAVGPGVSELDDDCDDGDATVYAGAPPVVCDLRDNDCDPNTWEPAEVRVDGLPAGPLATAAIGAGAQVELCEGRHEAHDLILPPDVTLVGLVARDRVRVDAGGVGAALRVEGALTLRQLTVVGGAGVRVGADTWGGAVWVAPGQALTAEDVRVTGSSAGHGGGLWLGEDARATLVGVRIDTNVGDAGGAIVNEGGGVVAE
ncbi:MAG TPA: putative metal-binding motif-containing protein, partial [Myxococcota bacterium]|nr:putative metal-binding motif-containing protein [Myxococcota bacterium]